MKTETPRRTRSKTLTAAFARTVTTPGRYGDGGRGSHGLYLRVWTRSNGRVGKSWAQRIRVDGRLTNLGLGTFPAVLLAEARRRALTNRQAIEEGRDPRRGGVPSLGQACEQVIALRARGWKDPERIADQWRASFRVYVSQLNDKPVNEITRADVLAAIAPSWSTKPAAAKLALQRVRIVLRWAVAAGHAGQFVADSSIEAALPRTDGATHHKALQYGEVAAALATVRASTAQPAGRLALELVVLTATRAREALGAKWSEIDLEAKVWRIPASRMKGGSEHRVPLSSRALDVLREARKLHRGGDMVFPSSRTKSGEVATHSIWAMLRRLGIACTVHGFRASFRSWCADSAVSREVAEAALAHVAPGIESVYQRSDLLAARADVMEAWAAYTTGK